MASNPSSTPTRNSMTDTLPTTSATAIYGLQDTMQHALVWAMNGLYGNALRMAAYRALKSEWISMSLMGHWKNWRS